MTSYTLSLSQQMSGYEHPHPNRTARRGSANGWDTLYQIWSNRKAMARSIRMQERSGPSRRDWTALEVLSDTEGY